MSATTVLRSLEHEGRTYALAFDGLRAVLSDDVDGTIYVGALERLDRAIPRSLAIALTIAVLKASEPLCRCGRCKSPYTRATFELLELIDERDGIEVRKCGRCPVIVAAPCRARDAAE